jgi:sulfite oxidase
VESKPIGRQERSFLGVARYGKRVDMLVHEEEPFNAEPPPGALARSSLTPLDSFYVRAHGGVPDIDQGAWRLEICGLTERSLEVSLEDLRDGRFTQREVVATLQCAGNRRSGLIAVRDIPGEAPWESGATGTARWRGIALAEVLTVAGVDPRALHVAFVGADGCTEADPPQRYGASIPLAKALGAEVLLAYEMNGKPLRPVHGAPVRVLVPGYIGARSVKWVSRIELRAEPWDGYFQQTAYRLLAAGQQPGPGVGMALTEVAVNADVLEPQDGATVSAGPVEINGYAFAGGEREVALVDVSIDGGETWTRAELLEDQGRWAWRLWRATVALPVGEGEVVVRAWDTAANTQPERPATVWNPKGYVNNSWGRVRLHVSA